MDIIGTISESDTTFTHYRPGYLASFPHQSKTLQETTINPQISDSKAEESDHA